MEKIKCPFCRESYYQELYTITTAAYYPPTFKNGININPDKNLNTHVCRCVSCGKSFSYRTQLNKIIDKEVL